ncbi:ABA4-like family protein [Sphingomonas rosea]|uniref:ABA4-like family protein n=1 Tax=Sphingomonas rosea TaxID=335605 RepID=A0ABP7U5Z7_9SPHN
MWASLFGFTNLLALVAWALLILAPRRPAIYSIILFAGVGLLCLTYSVLLALLLAGAVDPGGAGAGASFQSIEGIRSIFATDGGVVVGWTHYLAFDLFVGLWISRDADAKGFGRLVQAPILLLTFFAGPFGLFLWLIVRERRARATAKVR